MWNPPFSFKAGHISGFLESFPSLSFEGRKPKIEADELPQILNEFKSLRLSDEQVYLRSGSVNRLNGMIGMNFSCDGSHYIEYDEFFSSLKEFGNTESCDLRVQAS